MIFRIFALYSLVGVQRHFGENAAFICRLLSRGSSESSVSIQMSITNNAQKTKIEKGTLRQHFPFYRSENSWKCSFKYNWSNHEIFSHISHIEASFYSRTMIHCVLCIACHSALRQEPEPSQLWHVASWAKS